MGINFKYVDHSDQVLRSFNTNVEAALEAIGNQAVSHAKQTITSESRVDTGALRNSVSHQVNQSEKAVYIGTNQSYAIYNEYGTGIYAEGGGGRKTPWFYVDAHGEGHWTHGMKAIHFIKNACANHVEEYKAILQKFMSRVK